MPENDTDSRLKSRTILLLLSISAISVCAIVYELGIGSLSSYLLGNSVYQFSVTIGLFMTAMGIGSYASKYVTRHLIETFVFVELAIGLSGGFSCPILFAAYSFNLLYVPTMWGLIILIGTLIGLELPLLTRIFREYTTLRIALANALTLDYIGGLIGSLAFPLLLLPFVGIIETSMMMGLANIAVVIGNLILFRREIQHLKWVSIVAGGIMVGLIGSLIVSNPVSGYLEQRLYSDRVILSKTSKYQRIVLTRWKDDIRLFINGRLQFSTRDEHRYHEALIHPAASLVSSRSQVLVLGGGDGLAIREILKYDDVEKITLVDLDHEMTDLARQHPMLRQLNQNGLDHPKVTVINQDAQQFLQTSDAHYNLIIIDLPDPDDVALVSLYAKTFYRLVKRHLAKGGLAVTQSSSPFFARKAFWCIHQTIEAAEFQVVAYRVYVPSFGEWGFNIFGEWQVQPQEVKIDVPTRYLSDDIIPTLFLFDRETSEIKTQINTLLTPILLAYHREGWEKWGF